MTKGRIQINFGQLDLDTLNTDQQIREAAKAFIPEYLKQSAENAAEFTWDYLHKSLSGMVDGTKSDSVKVSVNNSVSEKRRFIEDAGRKLMIEATKEERKGAEDFIYSQLKMTKLAKVDI